LDMDSIVGGHSHRVKRVPRSMPAPCHRVVERVRPVPGELLGQSLIERDDDFVSFSLPDLLPNLRLNREFVRAVT
jgi:hypothetical protein